MGIDTGGSPAAPYFGPGGRQEATEEARRAVGGDRESEAVSEEQVVDEATPPTPDREGTTSGVREPQYVETEQEGESADTNDSDALDDELTGDASNAGQKEE